MSHMKTLLADLIRFESITPSDAGCQEYMIQYLEALGFDCERFDAPPVKNFFARLGNQAPLLVFAGHTDVVAPGDYSKWQKSPFELFEDSGFLRGRGVADMKGSLACMLAMVQRFVITNPNFQGSLGFLITSGEEGDEYEKGTPFVMGALKKRGISIDYCVVGEPSSTKEVGDVIKIGRRGSLTGYLTLEGKQGHVAYPHLAANPIHLISPVLKDLATHVWDEGNAHFPPTSFQITHIQAGGEGNNIIPGEITVHFNLRYSTEQTAQGLQEKISAFFNKYGLNPKLDWRLSGEPFLTASGVLLEVTVAAIEQVTGKKPILSTSGGTSDGRFIAPYGVQVIELGLINESIHQINEWVRAGDLEVLEAILLKVCDYIFFDYPRIINSNK